MKPDNINAISMILMAVVTVVTIYFFRTKPIKNIAWKVKIPSAIGGAVFALFFFAFAIRQKMCIEIAEPFGQFELTALCVMGLILLVDRKTIMFVSCALALLGGVQLQVQFNGLVHNSEEYWTIDANTHEPMAKGCSERKTPDGIILQKQWHTWFTGIYTRKK
ncbi:hypothetical protein FY034_00620 [Trichlorobacter lovleyi]|uniref:hypothetical protein n=1 Tax=Trichlorobacter lovleyi TaxID=313985 RepID=UPI00223F3857|nr:hypothetical protein [Trichlorobacter lovleyi]QOX77505.1 hypothetical protein FY034_00620 [Trichlorobacter lovleyi]